MAVAGKPLDLLNKEEILKRITTYDIYRHYFGPFKINEVCINHFRGERDESFIIGNKKSMDLTHKDFGDSYWTGDAFHLVQQIYKVDFYEALKIIDKDFGLGLADNNHKVIKPTVITWEQPKIEVVRPMHFIVETKKFTREELRYWADYHIDVSDLKKENIYSVKNIWRNRSRIPPSLLLTFGYYDEEKDKWKIYRPHGEKGKKVKIQCRKWDGNFDWYFCENLDYLDFTKPIWVEKSRKDRIVLNKVLETNNVCSIQAEDISCFSEETIDLLKNCKDITGIGDGDSKGLQYTKSINDSFGWNIKNPSQSFLPLTDFADIARVNGLEFVKNLLKTK